GLVGMIMAQGRTTPGELLPRALHALDLAETSAQRTDAMRAIMLTMGDWNIAKPKVELFSAYSLDSTGLKDPPFSRLLTYGPPRGRAREYGSLAPARDVGVRPPGRDGQNARADHAAIASDVRLPLPDGLEPPYRPVHGETDAPDRRRLARNGKEACGSEPASKAELVGTSCGTRGRTAHEIPRPHPVARRASGLRSSRSRCNRPPTRGAWATRGGEAVPRRDPPRRGIPSPPRTGRSPCRFACGRRAARLPRSLVRILGSRADHPAVSNQARSDGSHAIPRRSG